ncbi:MAG: hypothetical protein OEZ00_01230 [Dehalococcoidia bacterium]|nr:hypothetical protein [Dehalococcoidia bacterium]
MMMKIKCPKCDTEGSLSLLEPNYEGPYRCWKCRELFSIVIEGNEVKSWEPLTEKELEEEQERRRQIEELKAKFKKQPPD